MITAERLHEVLHYEPSTGILRWKITAGGAVTGKVAGNVTIRGYRLVSIDGQRYMSHRLAWLYMTGSWPKEEIDHRNGMGSDNAWNNLREATHSENMQNRRVAHKNNKSGLLGVVKFKDRFLARISLNSKKYDLGSFATREEAHAAYIKAKRAHHPGGLL